MLRLQDLPFEILINIFSYLEEVELIFLQELSLKFNFIINNNELWKNFFKSKLNTIEFPSFSQQSNYNIEYLLRKKGLNQWKHNRSIKTKYVISPNMHQNWQLQQQVGQTQIEKILFNYPKCICYNDGTITIINLQSKKNLKKKVSYIPCTTPQGCSTMDFNSDQAIFGRFDGRIFGKSLTNKSYLDPVMEFNDKHQNCVTAITTTNVNTEDNVIWSTSGAEDGEVIWWCENKLHKRWKLSNVPIIKIFMFRNLTIIIDANLSIFIVQDLTLLNVLQIPKDSNINLDILQFIKFDYGGKLIVLGTSTEVFVISFDLQRDFNSLRKFKLADSTIQDIFIDNDTTLRDQNFNLTGNDGCYISVLTDANDILIFNIRESSINHNELRLHKRLMFNEKIYTAQLTNLVLVVALESHLKIIDPTNGDLVKLVQKTDKCPQFLKISQGRMIVGTGNTLNYLQYINDDDELQTRKIKHGGKLRSNKWTKTVNSEIKFFDEQQNLETERLKHNNLLIEKFGGDVFNNLEDEDEDLQLKIALLESQEQISNLSLTHNTSVNNNTTNSVDNEGNEEDDAIDEELKRALEESVRLQQLEDEDEQLRRALEQSINGNKSLERLTEEEQLKLALEHSVRNDHISDNTIDNASNSESSDYRVSTINPSQLSLTPRDEELKSLLELSQQNRRRTRPLHRNGLLSSNEDDEELQLALALSLSEINN